jgi:DNA-binding transcriptional LysR family regulator
VRLDGLTGETWLPSPLPSAARQAFDRLMQDSAQPVKACQIITRVSSLTSALLRSQPLLAMVPFSVVRQLVSEGQLVAVDIEGASSFEALGLLVPQRELTAAARTLVSFLEGFAASYP